MSPTSGRGVVDSVEIETGQDHTRGLVLVASGRGVVDSVEIETS